MDWTPSYYVLSALAAGVVIVVLVFAAAKLRIRPLWFAAIGLAGVASGIVYVVQHDARLGTEAQDQSPTGVRSNQVAGESTIGRTEPGAAQRDEARAPDIAKSEAPVRISDDQRAKIRGYLAEHAEGKSDQVDFSVVIGAAVPRQAQLKDLPATLADLLNGYNGDQYILLHDQMIIVDHQSRRIVAVIPGVG